MIRDELNRNVARLAQGYEGKKRPLNLLIPNRPEDIKPPVVPPDRR